MSYPPGVVTRTINVGDSLAVESGTGLTVRATLRSSRGMVWVATGERAVSAPEVRESAAAGEAVTFTPPVTDQAGWRDLATGSPIDVSAPGSHTHTYTIELVTFRGTRAVDIRVIGPFPLPTGDGSPVDADLLIEADTVPGLLVSVPDAWGGMVAAAEAAAEEAAKVAEAAALDYFAANPPPAGDDGREVELRTSATHVQWRLEGDSTWLDIIDLADLVGASGPAVELRTTATHIQWRLVGGAWANLVSLSALVGPAGPPNVLSKGTVTTGAPGSQADFSITGTAPEQVLNLTIPRGDAGAGAVPIATWTETRNKVAPVSAVDLGTGVFTATSHPFANGDMVTPFVDIPGAALRQYLPGGMLISAYYVANATANSFQLSETAGGAPLALSTRATMDLSKWHFESYSGFFSGFTGLDGKTFRLVVRGQYVLGFPPNFGSGGNTYWMRLTANDLNAIATTDTWGFGSGNLAPSWGIGAADVVFDVRGGVASVAGSVRVMGQITTTADATLVNHTRTENSIPSAAPPSKITRLGFPPAAYKIYWANGSTMEVYAL